MSDTITDDWGGLTDADIEELAASVEVVKLTNQPLYVAIYMLNGSSSPTWICGHSRDEIVNCVKSINILDHAKPVKLYKLDY